jgi:hypothetical protein
MAAVRSVRCLDVSVGNIEETSRFYGGIWGLQEVARVGDAGIRPVSREPRSRQRETDLGQSEKKRKLFPSQSVSLPPRAGARA